MQKFNQDRTLGRRQRNHEPSSLQKGGACGKALGLLLLGATMMLSGCGGSSNSNNVQAPPSLSGNWQFTVASPSDNSFSGGLQGGFLLQTNNSVTGGAVYSVSLPSQTGGSPTICNSGSATITGTVNGQNVTLTAVAGSQTFTFTGSLSLDGSTMVGSYTSTAGTAGDGTTACGTAQTGLQWSAVSVPPLFGAIQGSFHSTGGAAGLANQNFLVTGTLSQGQNIGASNATVTGTLNFVDPVSQLSDYPCFPGASVNGQISGSSVVLQIIGADGSNLGQIGGSSLGAVTYDSTPNGYVLHSAAGIAYAVNSPSCPGVGLSNAGDSGNICLSLTASACQQPITLTPAFLVFPVQALGSTITQTITLANNDPAGSTLNSLQLLWQTGNGVFGGPSDFDGLPNFLEQDNCASSPGTPFNLATGQSCSIHVSFNPQESCPWIPFGTPPSVLGAAPAFCPFPLTASLMVVTPFSADSDLKFAVAVSGYGASAIEPSTPELDFGAEAVSGSSLPQLLSFTNQGSTAVQILGSAPCVNVPPTSGHNTLPHPLLATSPVAGLQVVANGPGSVGGSITPVGTTIEYSCDSDPTTLHPNFQISSDTCTGTLLPAGGTCSLQVAYVPQLGTGLNAGLDYFLELNTVQCTSTVTSACEIDSGRFPVELRANPPSPLRMSPGAGLNFGIQAVGHAAPTQTITLFNDPTDPNSATITFVGKISAHGDYSESDDCPVTLPPGGSCTLTVGFKPKITGFDPGTLSINYTPEPTGVPQTVYLRGTGR